MSEVSAKNLSALLTKPLGFRDMNAIVVDNMVNMRMTIVSMLNDAGFRKVYHANNGIEALELIDSEKIDVILSEYHLPKMDGLTLLNKVRLDPRTAMTPFIMTSATIEQTEVIRAIKAGVSEYVVKPFSAKILIERLHRAICNPIKHSTAPVKAQVGKEDKPDKIQILVVDDVPDNIQILMELLKKDYAVKAAINAETALKICSAEPAPDLVLLDIMMPQMDGLELCRQLKENPKTQHITVIFITALDQSDDIVKGFELGAVDYITKPFNPAVVKARIRTHARLVGTTKMARAQVDSLMDTAQQREKFIHVLQNDLKQPMEEIFQLLSQLDRNAKDSVKVKASAKTIHASTSRLYLMVDNMLAIAKIEDGSYQPSLATFSLTRLVSEVIETFTPTTSQKQLEILFNTSKDLQVFADSFLTQSILSNVLKNAQEAAPRGSAIRIQIDAADKWVRLSMHNQGKIPDEITPVFFSKYASHGKKNAAGLGAYAAKLMAEVQHGKIDFQTSLDEGTTLLLYLRGN